MPTISSAEQGSEQWFLDRLGLATASRFNDVLCKIRNGYGASHKNYVAELTAERLTGRSAPSFTSQAMQNGIDNEPVARLNYMLQSGNDVEETGFWKHDELEAGASPDGLVNDEGLLEIKCPNINTHLDTLRARKVPKQYIAQVQGQMWITGRKWCDFVSFQPELPENAQMIIIRMDRDDNYIEELEKEVRNFLLEVENQVEFVKSFK
jgi:putative phage-type endonuclease